MEELVIKIGEMLDEKMDTKFSKMLDEKLDQKLEEKLDRILDQKLEEKLDRILDQKLEEKLDRILDQKLEEKLDRILDQKLEEKLDQKLDQKLDAKFLQLENRLNEKIKELREDMMDRFFLFEQEYGDRIKAMSDYILVDRDKNLEMSAKVYNLENRVERNEVNIFACQNDIFKLQQKVKQH